MTDEQVQEKNAQDFATSETNAESAAMQQLGLPTVVAIADVVAGLAGRRQAPAGDRISRGRRHRGRRPGGGQRPAAGHQARRPRDRGVHPRRRRPERHAHAGIGRGLAAQGCSGVLLGPAAQGRHGHGRPRRHRRPVGRVDVLPRHRRHAHPRRPHRRSLHRGHRGDRRPTAWSQNIGGIQFKMAAARDAGATVFLVPAGTAPTALRRRAAGPAAGQARPTLHDAVTALNDLTPDAPRRAARPELVISGIRGPNGNPTPRP